MSIVYAATGNWISAITRAENIGQPDSKSPLVPLGFLPATDVTVIIAGGTLPNNGCGIIFRISGGNHSKTWLAMRPTTTGNRNDPILLGCRARSDRLDNRTEIFCHPSGRAGLPGKIPVLIQAVKHINDPCVSHLVPFHRGRKRNSKAVKTQETEAS